MNKEEKHYFKLGFAGRIVESFARKPVYRLFTNGLIEDYINLSNHQWKKKKELRDAIFNNIINDYLDEKRNE